MGRARMNLSDTWKRPLVRRVLLLAAGLLVLWAVAGFLVLPPLLRPFVERKLAEALHRPATVRRLSINPFALSAALEGLVVKEKGGSGPFFSFERLYVNLEAVSLLRGGPVIRAITLTKPSVSLVRNADGTYNIQDLLDEASKPKPSEKPLRFSVNNIRVEGGSVDFDDRPEKTKHTIRDIRIGIPFLSNIPSRVEITTEPVFEAKVNGSPFDLHGETKPFSQSHETRVNLDFTDVDLPYYLAYLPASLPPKLKSGRLDAKMTIAFTQGPKEAPALLLSGTAALRKLAVEMGGQPLLACERLDAVLSSFDVFRRKARLTSLKVVGPELWVAREKKGEFALTSALKAPATRGKAGTSATKQAEAPSGVFGLEIGEMGIERGRIHYDDQSLPRPFRAELGDFEVSLKGFSTAPGRPALLQASAKSDAGETLTNGGTFSMEPFALEGEFALGGLLLKRYQPLFEELVKFDVEDGVLDLKTKYRFATGDKANTTLTGLSAELKSPRLRKRGEKEPFFKAPSLKMSDTALDLGKHGAVLGELASAGGVLAVSRDKNGDVDLFKLMAERPPAASVSPQPPSAPWNIALGRLALDGYTVKIADSEPTRPARYTLTRANILLEKFSTARGARALLAVRFGVDGKGVASARGPIGLTPIFADLKADVKGIDLVPLQSYIIQGLKLSLARGTLSAAGTLSFSEGASGKASLTYKGDALVAGVLAVDQSTNLDFIRWEAFSASGMRAGFNPMFLELSRLALSGLACDLAIESDGTTNLRKVLGTPAPAEEADSEQTAAAETPAAPPASPPPAAAATSPPAASEKVPIRIDTLTLQGGRIGLADHFVQPNYSATLSDLAGRVTGLSSREGTVAQLEVRGSLANHSPLEITGSVNPLSASSFADVKASFRDIDLAPFTPYSGKYAGYTISRGVLTMEVSYKLQNRKLAAQNRFLVDQFEFGDKVESKAATKLPVKLAVSLLKDRDGVIDLDLPIEGSLDDPKFRIGRVILRVLGNLIAKAATAPFSLLGKLLGGGGEQELSSVDFADGRETLDEAAKKKLDAIAKALENRPALKLEVMGRFSGDKDSEGLKRLRFERKVKAQKLADLSKNGQAPASVDDIVLDEKEYPTWLEKAYKREKFPKPRNALGLAKSLPASEMENLMLANVTVTADDLRQLALARANAVKDHLAGPGKIDAARIFVLEPGEKPAEPTGKARASRVDFTLRGA